MSRTLLFEIGTEEIPAGFVLPALAFMEKYMKKSLGNSRVDYGEIVTYATPRRLTVMVDGVSEAQKDRVDEIMGPSVKVAFDKDGKPTKAAEGFARGQGVTAEQLKVKETPKGSYVYVVKEEKGGKTMALLPELLKDLVGSIPFKKSMRWGDREQRFARPIHWFMALLGEEVVEFEIEGVKSDRITYGHRFLDPAPIALHRPEEYEGVLEKAHVIVNHNRRKDLIWKGVQEESRKAGGVPKKDEELLEEVNFLTEYPVALCGSFAPRYLELPPEVLITVMKEHQRYFPIFDESGNLINHFVVVANIVTPDMDVVTKGNERVLEARLADAQFFFQEDKKVPLMDLFDKLKEVVFQEKLGTSYDKAMRFKELALYMADRVAPRKKDLIERTALLAKADLESQMVYEFPELQGVMGREYARIQCEPEEVSLGIYEHYLPRFAGDELPTTITGALVGIADRIDTIVGCFGIGLIPTGSEDPYGIRRDALGVIHVVLHQGLRLSISQLVDEAMKLLADRLERDAKEVREQVLTFLRQRLYHLWVSEGFRQDLVDAVLHGGFDDLVVARKRLGALQDFSKAPDFEDLMTTFKRVVNILPEDFEGREISPALFKDREEEALYESLIQLEDRVRDLVERENHLDALKTIATMKEKVDAFFDGVLVMAKEEEIKMNRLSLLSRIAALFAGLADLSKVVLSK